MSKIKNVAYYFGRLNLITYVPKEKKGEYIFQSLISGVKIQRGKSLWGFFDIEKINFEGDDYVFGKLVRYNPEAQTKIIDEEKQIIKIIHLKTGIIAYHTGKKASSRIRFTKNFCKLIEEANSNLFIDAQIQTIHDEVKILEFIKRFDNINRIEITLHPSNPSNRERWKRTDEKLRKMKVESYKEIYSGKEIEIEEEDEAYGNILMAGDGYGKAVIEGEIDGKPFTVSTEKLPVRAFAPKEDSKKIIKKLAKDFNKIFERFDKNED